MNIKELAKKLDLSITTVSRALGGYPDVSDKTRERVKRFANKFIIISRNFISKYIYVLFIKFKIYFFIFYFFY